ncbi:chymotrypsinogen B-like protein [Dinothrombium tinctorium]|uniref:Chymotrypsinogen B-like protein n=1 Tax=Dinothrombium tinctorium TaxID=1965070 RepID=A0A3S3PXI8_9ACAR|nr:chymotrypsinogen B-like protein [Dinothrombium tinctorium]
MRNELIQFTKMIAAVIIKIAFYSLLIIANGETSQKDSSAKCGALNRRRPKRIVDGNEVPNPNPYPWTVFLVTTYRKETGESQKLFCAGSIIQPTFILTVAHCIPPNTERLHIYYGSSVDLNDPSTHNIISAIRWYIHPNYNYYVESTWEHDIAIIEVKQGSIDFENDQVGQICLPEDHINTDGQEMITAGYGNPQRYGASYRNPRLREATVYGVNSTFFGLPNHVNGSITAVGFNGFLSFYDIGDPLMLERNGVWTLVGVARYICLNNESQNCDPRAPMLFTRVSNYLDWIILTIINPHINYSDILDTFNHLEGETSSRD